MATPLLQYGARFDGGGDILGLGWGGYNESRPCFPLFFEFLTLFVALSGEQVALPMCWKGTSLSTISRVSVPVFFSGRAL